MLKSKLQFFVSFVTFCLFIAVLVISNAEAAHYVTEPGTEETIGETWKGENWTFWPPATTANPEK